LKERDVTENNWMYWHRPGNLKVLLLFLWPRVRRREPDPRHCDQCGDPITPIRANARYFSPACRQKADRARKA